MTCSFPETFVDTVIRRFIAEGCVRSVGAGAFGERRQRRSHGPRLSVGFLPTAQRNAHFQAGHIPALSVNVDHGHVWRFRDAEHIRPLPRCSTPTGTVTILAKDNWAERRKAQARVK